MGPNRREFLGATVAVSQEKDRVKPNTIQLRTHEWFGDKLETFDFPRGWHVSVKEMKGHGTPPLSADALRKAIRSPVGTPLLREIAAGKTTAAIAFDDMTRPTPAYEVVPHVLAELYEAGLRDENILFVAAHGAHNQMNGMEVAKKIGEQAARRHPWINHNIWESLIDIGTTASGNLVKINPYFYNAEVKIGISGLRDHTTAGYSGGGKIVLPGISGVQTIRNMHRLKGDPVWVNRNGVLFMRLWENKSRQDIIEGARLAGVHFSVQIVYNQARKPVHVVAGDIVKAHHQAARFAVNYLATEYAKNADIIVINAYPKGLQFEDHFHWAEQGLKDGGSVVMINQNPMGQEAWHYGAQSRIRGGGSYFKARAERRKLFPEARQLLLYSQYYQSRETYPPETVPLGQWKDVIARLSREHKGDVEVAVYPYGALQHPVLKLDLPDDV